MSKINELDQVISMNPEKRCFIAMEDFKMYLLLNADQQKNLVENIVYGLFQKENFKKLLEDFLSSKLTHYHDEVNKIVSDKLSDFVNAILLRRDIKLNTVYNNYLISKESFNYLTEMTVDCITVDLYEDLTNFYALIADEINRIYGTKILLATI